MNTTTSIPTASRPEWSPACRVTFRWAFLFLAMLTLPELIQLFLGEGRVANGELLFWRSIVPWISKHVFGIAREIKNFGTGDTGYANLRLIQQAMIAAIGAGLWSAARRGARNYDRMYYWLRVATRLSLATLLLSYGISKIFHVQFPYPPLTTLIQPFGELTPHRLLWSFMGFSRPYQVFAGILECGAALLLFSRRTTTLGALLSGAALVNVLVLDWCYGVFVKLIVVRMLLLTGFLLLKDANRLAKVLLWNSPTDAANDSIPWHGWRWKWPVFALKLGVIAWILGSQVQWAVRRHPTVDDRGRPALYGIYRVERHSVGGQEIPDADSTRWTLAAFDNIDRNESYLVMRSAGESWRLYNVKYDEGNSHLTVGSDQESLRITRPDAGVVRLDGALDKKQIDMTLRKLPDPEFPLEKNAELRWIRRW